MERMDGKRDGRLMLLMGILVHREKGERVEEMW